MYIVVDARTNTLIGTYRTWTFANLAAECERDATGRVYVVKRKEQINEVDIRS